MIRRRPRSIPKTARRRDRVTRAPIAVRAATAVALAALFSGCSSIPTTHYYVLGDEGRGVAPAASVGEGIDVAVRAFRIDPPYDQNRLVYRIGEDSSEVAFYAYHRWAAPLAHMLPRAVSFGLATTPGVHSIEPLVPGRRYDGFVEGRLLALEEIDLPGSQVIRMRLELSLSVQDGATVWRKSMDVRRSTRTDDAGELASEMNALLRQALDEARGELALAVARIERPGEDG